MNGVEEHQKLPLESVYFFTGNNKQTTDLVNGRRHIIGKEQAKEFYADQAIMDPKTFDPVNWEDLQDSLALRPKMYQLWLGKQCLGYCGTGKMPRRWDKTANSSCPNCGIQKENADNLNRCPNKDQRLMLIKCMKDTKKWMADNHTHPELIEWVPKYPL